MSLTKVTYSMIEDAPANVQDFGAVGDGITNDSAAIQAAINSFGANAGTVYFPQGSYLVGTAINLNDLRGIRLVGTGALVTSNSPGTRILWAGGAASGSMLTAQGAVSIEIEHITFQYTNAAYNGNLLSFEKNSHPLDTTGIHIHHCSFIGSAGVTSAARLIALSNTFDFTIEYSFLNYAAVGIGCTSASNSGITIGNGMWFDKNFTDCAVKARGSNWSFGNFISKSITGANPLTTFLKIDTECNALSFTNGVFLDGGSGGGTLIDFSTGIAKGIVFNGTTFNATSGGTAVKLSSTLNESAGFAAHGCYIAGIGTGFNLGSCVGVDISGNNINASTSAWTAANQIDFSIKNNNTYGISCGTSILVDGFIYATSTGTGGNENGRKLVSVTVKSTTFNEIGIFAFNGSAGTTSVISASGNFSTTIGNAGTINVGYDASPTAWKVQNKKAETITVSVTILGAM
jgi:hypothetical protein